MHPQLFILCNRVRSGPPQKKTPLARYLELTKLGVKNIGGNPQYWEQMVVITIDVKKNVKKRVFKKIIKNVKNVFTSMVITDESLSQLLGARARIASPTKFTSMPAESVESRTLSNVFVR